jgi:hypothetical protein
MRPNLDRSVTMRLTVAASSLMLLLAACGGRAPVSSQNARVRNHPPATCTQADFNACPAMDLTTCANGEEPVIDYSSDCCGHFSCQTACTPAAPCPGWPAPSCPPGTQLEIATATDCCPAYRCAPATNCDGVMAACPAAMPWCGEGVMPIEVGQTDSCCPIYQCPCGPIVVDGGVPTPEPGPVDGGPAPAPVPDPTTCGCTYPVCAPGEQLQCLGGNICGYPCSCVPATSNCMSDADCGPNMHCDTSLCLPPPDCQPGGDCPAVCAGVCVGFVQTGCKADSECPSGQRCDLQCRGWGCAPAAGPDGGVGDPCTCPEGDFNCTCQADGSCTSQECSGMCVPVSICDAPLPPSACPPPPLMPCASPTVVGTDPTTCCPIYECTQCTPMGAPCPVGLCECGVQVGTDQNCCPIIACPEVPPSGECPAACRTDVDCAAGQVCMSGFCGAAPTPASGQL